MTRLTSDISEHLSEKDLSPQLESLESKYEIISHKNGVFLIRFLHPQPSARSLEKRSGLKIRLSDNYCLKVTLELKHTMYLTIENLNTAEQVQTLNLLGLQQEGITFEIIKEAIENFIKNPTFEKKTEPLNVNNACESTKKQVTSASESAGFSNMMML